jgi:hypothetical protein
VADEVRDEGRHEPGRSAWVLRDFGSHLILHFVAPESLSGRVSRLPHPVKAASRLIGHGFIEDKLRAGHDVGNYRLPMHQV